MSATATTTTVTATEAKPRVASNLTTVGKAEPYKYADYLPARENTTLPPIEPFGFVDRGLAANRDKANLLGAEGVQVKNLTPRIGTEIRNLQLSQLSDAQKDELALLLAERGVVVFRNQDFKDIGIDKQKAFARYFGPLHTHPTGAHIKGHFEFHNIYAGPDSDYLSRLRETRLNTIIYHSDVSYEQQPPGVTILTMLTLPPTGGDTAWALQTTAFERLSKPIQTLLEGLRAEHNGFVQADLARRAGNTVRREPISTEHPVVRVHPVTGEKALFVNKGFTKRIVGLKTEESDALLNLLFQHIASGQDFQVRVAWEEGTVALWDNRITTHTPISDYDERNPQELRHGVRLAALADVPTGVNGLQG